MAQPLDVVIKGMALNDFGFVAENTISGVGLNTFGFLWECAAIWSPSDDPVTTTWVDCGAAAASVEVCIS